MDLQVGKVVHVQPEHLSSYSGEIANIVENKFLAIRPSEPRSESSSDNLELISWDRLVSGNCKILFNGKNVIFTFSEKTKNKAPFQKDIELPADQSSFVPLKDEQKSKEGEISGSAKPIFEKQEIEELGAEVKPEDKLIKETMQPTTEQPGHFKKLLEKSTVFQGEYCEFNVCENGKTQIYLSCLEGIALDIDDIVLVRDEINEFLEVFTK